MRFGFGEGGPLVGDMVGVGDLLVGDVIGEGDP